MVRCVTRTGLTTVRTTAPFTKPPGEYRRWGSSARIWKSVRLRVRDLSGSVSLDNSKRRVEANDGDDDDVGVTSAHMLCRCGCCQEIARRECQVFEMALRGELELSASTDSK